MIGQYGLYLLVPFLQLLYVDVDNLLNQRKNFYRVVDASD